MDINLLVNITSRAWAIPILSSLYNGVPGRQAHLLSATGAGRTALSQSIHHLIKLGLLERNPGHGHPLRPEFRLTKTGIEAAEIAYQIYDISEKEDQDLLRRSWVVPILTSLHWYCHFNEIKKNLRTINDRALSQSLKSLEDHQWVLRNVDDRVRPPRSSYVAINAGKKIGEIAGSRVNYVEI